MSVNYTQQPIDCNTDTNVDTSLFTSHTKSTHLEWTKLKRCFQDSNCTWYICTYVHMIHLYMAHGLALAQHTLKIIPLPSTKKICDNSSSGGATSPHWTLDVWECERAERKLLIDLGFFFKKVWHVMCFFLKACMYVFSSHDSIFYCLPLTELIWRLYSSLWWRIEAKI